MRVAVVGGTRFIGRRIVELLAGRGDQVMVVHRGITEPGGPDGWVDCRHLHVDRSGFAGVADQVRRFRPDAVIDSDPGTAADVGHVLPHLPDVHLVVLSSMDVYRAYGLARAGREGEGLPIDETSAPRDERYPYRGLGWGEDDYDKLDVEPAYLARGGTVLRLPRTYGRHDPLRREEFVLRRMRAGRPRIPIGAGTTLWTRGHVDDVAAATLAALGHPAAPGEVFNVGEPTTRSILGWATQIRAAAVHHGLAAAEFVTVPDLLLPEDLRLTRAGSQHLLVSSRKITEVLGWRHGDVGEAVTRSVAWHLDNPPAQPDPDFRPDDAALAGA